MVNSTRAVHTEKVKSIPPIKVEYKGTSTLIPHHPPASCIAGEVDRIRNLFLVLSQIEFHSFFNIPNISLKTPCHSVGAGIGRNKRPIGGNKFSASNICRGVHQFGVDDPLGADRHSISLRPTTASMENGGAVAVVVVVVVVLVEVVVVVYNVHTAHADSPRDATDIKAVRPRAMLMVCLI